MIQLHVMHAIWWSCTSRPHMQLLLRANTCTAGPAVSCAADRLCDVHSVAQLLLTYRMVTLCPVLRCPVTLHAALILHAVLIPCAVPRCGVRPVPAKSVALRWIGMGCFFFLKKLLPAERHSTSSSTCRVASVTSATSATSAATQFQCTPASSPPDNHDVCQRC